jgi:hypothetical protein
VCVGFRRIWLGRQDFRLDLAETDSGSFGVGADGLVIGVGFGVFGLVIGVGFGVSGLFQCFWVVSCFWVSMGSLVRLKCWIVDGGNRS